MKLSIIVAASTNHVIGSNGKLPWRLKADLQHFKKVTMGHPIIMGRKTYESIGKPLPGRTNIVLSRTVHQIEGCVVASSLDAALKVASAWGAEEAFVIGGGKVYEEALPLADRVYLTRVQACVEGDTLFRFPDGLQFNSVVIGRQRADVDNDHRCTFLRYDRA
jgi:dihydrofolate reductase